MPFIAVPQKEMTSAERRRAERLHAGHQWLTGYCLSRFGGLSEQQREEAQAAAQIGLWHAACRFDPARGFQFSSYAGDCIRGEVLRCLRRERQQTRLDTVPLELPLGDSGGEFSDIVADPNAETPGGALLSAASFEEMLRPLPERQQAVLRAIYGEERTVSDLAQEWGLSVSRVGQLRLGALQMLKQLASGHNLRHNSKRKSRLKKAA